MHRFFEVGLAALALASALAAAGCKRASEKSADQSERPVGFSLPWIHDDYPGALARARAEGKPIVLELWAPWCHTCLSMKGYVLVDRALEPFADRFVWVALDTDRPDNAAVVERLPVNAWPTYLVLSGADESVQARHVGAASIGQFRDFLSQGERGHLDVQSAAGRIEEGSLLGYIRAGDRAASTGDHRAASDAYREAFDAAPPDFVRLPDVMVRLATALFEQSRWHDCVAFAFDHGASVSRGNTPAAIEFALVASGCAARLEDEPRRQELLPRLAAILTEVSSAGDAPLSLDDRSEALRALRVLADEMRDRPAARRYAEAQRELLERAVAEAPTAYAEMTFAGPRTEVHIYLGESEKVIRWLEALIKKVPQEYDPPYRLAEAQLALGRHAPALAAAERAVELAYGPRKALVQSLVAEIHRARGDRTAEIAARRTVVEIYEQLPDGQNIQRDLERARRALAEAETG